MPVEILLGRALAFCVHPTAAWRRLPASGRAMVVAVYLGAGYVTVLTALFVLE